MIAKIIIKSNSGFNSDKGQGHWQPELVQIFFKKKSSTNHFNFFSCLGPKLKDK